MQVAQRGADLLGGLAHAEDQVGLGDQPGGAALADDVEGAVVAEGRADPLEDPRHGLDVVGEDLRRRVEDLLEQLGVAGEVRHQDLDAGAGVERVDLTDGLGVEPGALVLEVVAGDAGDGRVAQPHRLHARRDPARLVAVERRRLAGVDLAEVAAPGALLAADEEGRLAVLPALEDVGAAGFLADRVQALALHQRVQLGVVRAHRRLGLDPRRLALDRGLGVAGLDPQHPAAFRGNGHPSRVSLACGSRCRCPHRVAAMDLRVFVEPQQGASYDDQLRVARHAEALGFEGFFRSDHYLLMGQWAPDGLTGEPGPTDAWTTLAGLARETSRLRLGTLVSSATFRHPGVLAIQAAQVDEMSGGRVELGLGAGWFAEEHAAYGIPFPEVRERFDRLGGAARGHHRVCGRPRWVSGSASPASTTSWPTRPALPKPVQSPLPVIVGGHGKRRTPALAARFASEFNVGFSPAAEVAELVAGVRAACAVIDRDPQSLTCSVAHILCCGTTTPTWTAGRTTRDPRSPACARRRRSWARRTRSWTGSGGSPRWGRPGATCSSTGWPTWRTWTWSPSG